MDLSGASPPSDSGRSRRFAPGPPTARSARGSLPAVVVIEGPLRQTDITGLCNRLGQLIERGRPTTVVCDVAALTEPDLVTVDALARMQLTAVRLGSRLRLCGAGSELQAFLALVGLSDVLPLRPDSRLQVVGQPEQREEGRGVEKRVERGDPAS